ncbi:hypothetical protein [Streptomyces ochraceiscleroticus]|uniref:Uncharacterized protein n=1 Tax=Streptomyces ochraceiscleroticus TaxID=47761 RepID=A0ABW1MT52_9ACTN|nr:hypothetical protein [Streptomyces ochraceiscleroticus]
MPALDEWISLQFTPGHRDATIDRLHAAQRLSAPDAADEVQAIIRDCDSKLTRYRSLLDSGAADSATVAQWITETEAHRKTAAARLTAQHHVQLSRHQIAGRVQAAGDIADALQHAERPAKARLYAELGLRLDYHHTQRKVLVGIAPGQHLVGESYVGRSRNPLTRSDVSN